MALFKRLELSGFKSFAKAARFDFESPIVAIVGPNGSGKSNVVEAIQWVLGEQSLKSLRGHRGEDLIFNGTSSSPRLSKAAVLAVFDNAEKHFPVDFGEVAIGRRVYRDGKGEYVINDSEVRLKDVIGLLAHVGLGVSQHPIISQGEADRILYVSPKERQGMIEEALGLKVYQYRREEAEKKLQQTENNMREAQALRAEARPHLEHLKRLVDRYERASEIKTALVEKASDYLSRFEAALGMDRKRLADAHAIEHERRNIEKQLAHVRTATPDQIQDGEELRALESELGELRAKRIECERELGRAEGMLEASAAAGTPDDDTISREAVEELLVRAEDDLSSALESDSISEIHATVQGVIERLSAFLTERHAEERMRGDAHATAARVAEWKQTLTSIAKKETVIAAKWEKRRGAVQDAERVYRETFSHRTALEARARELDDSLRRLQFEAEILKNREIEWEREHDEIKHFVGEIVRASDAAPFVEGEREKMRREIDRLKFRLEEAGGVDASVLREHEDASARDQFFEHELKDLVASAQQLRGVSRELAERIEEDFSRGVGKINTEFDRFFQMMFGGGKATLAVMKERASLADDHDARPPEGGIHIDVSLPRKKIRGLDMLSGGERSLVAVALLFALSTVSPPPFLVLDETDAALDEANSLRYGDMLKELSRSTQIITITHNRQTMRRAGILYGVTAGSDGVSRLLSLKLSEAEDLARSHGG